MIVSEAERLATIVNDILWASRLDADSMRVSIQSCDAEALAQGVIEAAEVHPPPNDELIADVAGRAARVAGDPDKIRQVMANLARQAIKYSPDGGRSNPSSPPVRRSLRFAVTRGWPSSAATATDLREVLPPRPEP